MAGTFRDVELAGWSKRPASYDQHMTPITNQVIAPMIAALGVVAGKKVLDICCGPGHLAGSIAAEGAEVEGIDFAASMIVRAHENYPVLTFRQADAEALPYAEGTFDHAVCAFGVMHLSRADVAIAEAFRVLRPLGRFVFTQWANDDELLGIVLSAIAKYGAPVTHLPDAPPTFRFSDPSECRRVLQASGFTDVRDDRVETICTIQGPDSLLELIYGGAVRAAMVLEAQEPMRREQIHDAVLQAAKANISNGVVVIRRPVVMAWGTKPG
jgi:ubiquinone/menaquinone biosynthesis C-methylase UbiE